MIHIPFTRHSAGYGSKQPGGTVELDDDGNVRLSINGEGVGDYNSMDRSLTADRLAISAAFWHYADEAER